MLNSLGYREIDEAVLEHTHLVEAVTAPSGVSTTEAPHSTFNDAPTLAIAAVKDSNSTASPSMLTHASTVLKVGNTFASDEEALDELYRAAEVEGFTLRREKFKNGSARPAGMSITCTATAADGSACLFKRGFKIVNDKFAPTSVVRVICRSQNDSH